MLRRSACGMNRKVFSADWPHPTEGARKASSAAANRILWARELIFPLFGVVSANLRDPCWTRQCKSWAANSLPRVRGRIRVGLAQLARGPRLHQHTRMRGGHTTIGRARHLRRTTTEAERLLWRRLRNDQIGWRFRRQHPTPPYIVDFACVEARVVIEADGGQHERAGDYEERDET